MRSILSGLLTVLVVLLLLQPATAQQPQPTKGPPDLEAMFMRLDKNHDGVLTADEVPPRMFKRLKDALKMDEQGGEQKITHDQFLQAVQSLGSRVSPRPQGEQGGPAAKASGTTPATEQLWEQLANGVLGQVADFEGAGGVKIAGYVRKPAGAGPFPLVFILHGSGSMAGGSKRPGTAANEQNREKMRPPKDVGMVSAALGRASYPPIPDFLAQGWAVYSIDYRPNARYMIDPLEFDDTVAAFEKARSFSFVDPKRVAMLGGSHGGHVTGRMASRVKLACAVLCAPAGLDLIALSHLAEKGTPIGANKLLIKELELRSGVTMAEIEKNPAAYHYSSLLTEVAQVQCPILMISGRNDLHAPLPVMDAYVEKLRSLGKEVETYHPDNGPHGFYFGGRKTIPETAEATRRAITFIKKQFEQAGR